MTSQGLVFYEKALEVVKSFDSFEKTFSQADLDQNEFSIASQHYDFLPPLITAFRNNTMVIVSFVSLNQQLFKF